MATPIGHSLAGLAVNNTLSPASGKQCVFVALLCLSMANAPDLDIIPGFLQGQPTLYHGSIAHSFGFALLVSITTATLYKLRRGSFVSIFLICFATYSSHLLLDFLSPDGRLPYGIHLFWPFSEATYLSPIPLLLGARHLGSTSASVLEFVRGVLSLYNVAAVGIEFLFIGPFLMWSRLYRQKVRVLRDLCHSSVGFENRSTSLEQH